MSSDGETLSKGKVAVIRHDSDQNMRILEASEPVIRGQLHGQSSPMMRKPMLQSVRDVYAACQNDINQTRLHRTERPRTTMLCRAQMATTTRAHTPPDINFPMPE